jgi:hypothetical protein
VKLWDRAEQSLPPAGPLLAQRLARRHATFRHARTTLGRASPMIWAIMIVSSQPFHRQPCRISYHPGKTKRWLEVKACRHRAWPLSTNWRLSQLPVYRRRSASIALPDVDLYAASIIR